MDAFTHFSCNIMGEKQENDHLLAAFESLPIQSMLDFIILEKKKTIKVPPPWVMENSLALKSEWFITEPGTKDMSTWLDHTGELFSNYLIYGYIKDALPPQLQLHQFSRGIKRDVTQYKEFTDGSKWITWY